MNPQVDAKIAQAEKLLDEAQAIVDGKATAVVPVEIVAVLDRSGSMESTRTDAEGGFKQFLDEQRTLKGDCYLTLHQFDTVHETLYQRTPIARAEPWTCVPRGGTALWDAIGTAIRTAEMVSDRGSDEVVIFVVVTDGGENSSRLFSHQQLFDLIKRKRAAGWQFVFIGASEDAMASAISVGFEKTSAGIYSPGAHGTRSVYSNVALNVNKVRMGGHAGQSLTFSADQIADMNTPDESSSQP